MRRIRRCLGLAALILLASVAQCPAQRIKTSGSQATFASMTDLFDALASYEVTLLEDEPVQKELKIAEDQKARLEAALRDTEPVRKFVLDLRGISQEEQRQRFDELRKKVNEAEARVKDQLTPDQKKRLTGVYLQISFPNALRSAELSASLKLSDDQKMRLKTIREEVQKKDRELPPIAPGASDDALIERFQNSSKELETRFVAILDVQQRKQFEELKGPPVGFTYAEFVRANKRRLEAKKGG